MRNLHTIAIMPTSRTVPLVPFTCELYHALQPYMQVLRLSSHVVSRHLDPSVLEKCILAYAAHLTRALPAGIATSACCTGSMRKRTRTRW